MSDRTQKCEFCGTDFDWTDDQITLDAHLKLFGSGLGAMCDACGDKVIEIEIEAMKRADEQEREDG